MKSWATTAIVMITILTTSSAAHGKSALPTGPGMSRHAVDSAYFLAQKEKNPQNRLRYLSNVAIGYASRGDDEAASEILSQLREANLGNAYLLLASNIVVELIDADETNKALGFIAKLKDPAEKNSAIDAAVGFLIKKKNIDTAATLAKGVPNIARKNRLMLDVSEGYAANGFITNALEVADIITDSGKNIALATICSKLADSQNFQKAIEIATSISDSTLAQKSLAKVVQSQAGAHQFDAAIQTLKRITIPGARQIALQSIAIAYIQNNQFLEAKSISDGIVDAESRNSILSAAATEYALLKDSDHAQQMLNQIGKIAKGTAAFSVATELVRDDNFEKAFEIVNVLPEPDRLIYLPKLASEFGKSTQYLYSQLLLKQINPTSLRYLATEKFILSLATHAQPNKAIQLAGEILDPIVRDRTYGGLVDIFIIKNLFDAAGTATTLIQNPAQRLNRYCVIAKGSHSIKQSNDWLEKAHVELSRLQTPPIQIESIIKIAEVNMTASNPRRAEDTLLKTHDLLNRLNETPGEYLSAALMIITAHEKTGISTEGLLIIRQMRPESEQIKALLSLPQVSIPDPEIEKRRRALFRDIARQ